MKLISISKSDAKGKKLKAVFEKDGKKKTINFGAEGMDDWTLGATEAQRKSYRARAIAGKTAPADTASALAYHILWGDSRSRATNITAFKKKYNV